MGLIVFPMAVGLATIADTLIRSFFLEGWYFVAPMLSILSMLSVAPASATQSVPADPIPDETLPLDEYFCRLVLQTPWNSFIGFTVDEPFSASDARLAWLSNTAALADGKGVGIDWTSSNLNQPWFGGSQFIPNTDDCSGKAWRQVIADGLMQASAGAC